MAEGTIGLAEPSTITKSLRTVTQDMNGTEVHQEVMTIGGAGSSLQLAAVVATAPPSTSYALAVRIAGGPSSAVDLQARVNQGLGNSSAGDRWLTGSMPLSTVWASSAGFHFDSSGALQVTGATASTVVTVARSVGNSSAQDFMPVRLVDSSGTGFLAPGLEYTDGSTTSTLAAPGLAFQNGSNATMRMVGSSTPLPMHLRNSTGDLIAASTAAPAAGSIALHVRAVQPTRASVHSTITSTASTAFYELISSLAGFARCVYAYSVTSTAVTPMAVEFISNTNSVLWGLDVGSGSSGVSGANLAVSPPGALFQTATAGALNVRLSVTGVQVRFAASYFSE